MPRRRPAPNPGQALLGFAEAPTRPAPDRPAAEAPAALVAVAEPFGDAAEEVALEEPPLAVVALPPALREWFEERAGIREHDGEMPRAAAEAEALAEVLCHAPTPTP